MSSRRAQQKLQLIGGPRPGWLLVPAGLQSGPLFMCGKLVDNTPVKGQDKRPLAALDGRVAAAVSHERGLLI